MSIHVCVCACICLVNKYTKKDYIYLYLSMHTYIHIYIYIYSVCLFPGSRREVLYWCTKVQNTSARLRMANPTRSCAFVARSSCLIVTFCQSQSELPNCCTHCFLLPVHATVAKYRSLLHDLSTADKRPI